MSDPEEMMTAGGKGESGDVGQMTADGWMSYSSACITFQDSRHTLKAFGEDAKS